MEFWKKRWILVNRNIFTAIPFFSSGFGGEELWRGIADLDVLRILAAVSIMLQSLGSSFIFIRNGIKGRTWKSRNIIFFLVGALTGLIVGLTVYYPIAYNSLRLRTTDHQNTTDSVTVTNTENLNLHKTVNMTNEEVEFSAVSKLRFLIPTLLLSILVLVSTIYGLSIKLEREEGIDETDNSNRDTDSEEGLGVPLSQKSLPVDIPKVN